MVVPTDFLYWMVGALIVMTGVGAALHALLNKRDPYAAIVWVVLCLSLPMAGSLLYILFGVNRIHWRATKLMKSSHKRAGPATLSAPAGEYASRPKRYHDPSKVSQDGLTPEISTIAGIGSAVTGMPLLAGNKVTVYYNGEEAYPAMLKAIDEAKSRVWLDTYIFDNDDIGKAFVEALGAACVRGVDVRVQVDGMGTITTWPRIDRILRKRGIHVVRFLPPRLFPPQFFINLRNHRKLLIIDSKIAFTGGMNISDKHRLNREKRTGFKGFFDRFHATAFQDIHFRMEGPILEDFQFVFAREWSFTAQEELVLPNIDDAAKGSVLCRTILDGPDDYFERFHATLLGVISAARHRVHIMTPYFLPQRELVTALRSAAMRGVDVAIILPAETDQILVKWATGNILWELVGRGVYVGMQPPPFAHSKLLLVDGMYSHVGSANLDPRSLRLNFELTVECFDSALTKELEDHFDRVRKSSKEITPADLKARPLAIRMRDAICWLFSPYL